MDVKLRRKKSVKNKAKFSEALRIQVTKEMHTKAQRMAASKDMNISE
jgi:hypothetical protein